MGQKSHVKLMISTLDGEANWGLYLQTYSPSHSGTNLVKNVLHAKRIAMLLNSNSPSMGLFFKIIINITGTVMCFECSLAGNTECMFNNNNVAQNQLAIRFATFAQTVHNIHTHMTNDLRQINNTLRQRYCKSMS